MRHTFSKDLREYAKQFSDPGRRNDLRHFALIARAKEDEIARLTREVATLTDEVTFLRTQAYPEEYTRP